MAWTSIKSSIKGLALGLAAALLFAASAQTQSPGEAANTSGESLEGWIAAVLEQEGFEIVPASEWREARLYESEDPRIAVTNAPYQSIYGGRAYVEFLLLFGDRRIMIEAKRQSRSGSVDEKLPFVFFTALAALPEREFVLVMDGQGWREGARDWIEARAAETPGFTVLAPDALADWLARPVCSAAPAPVVDCVSAGPSGAVAAATAPPNQAPQ